ncbi:MAG: efflux RND transporter periplasmic adaptor subunit [Acidobacteriota bacterium]
MSGKKKLVIVLVGVGIVAAIVGFSLTARTKDATPVEVETLQRRPKLVAVVSATGEIQPKNYVELQAEISGVITELYVDEGDRVEKGDVLLRIDPVQTEAELRAQEAVLRATEAEARNQQAQISVQRTNVERDEANLRLAEVEVERARKSFAIAEATFARKQQLFEENLISRDSYELARNDLITAESALHSAEARLAQAKAQLAASRTVLEQAQAAYESALSRVAQQRSLLERTRDVFNKTVIRSPLTGVITQMNVEVGERAVPGTLNNPAATLMVIADLSVIEAELQVDETDIVDLALGQPAVIKVDALPNRPLEGVVTEIGNSAIQQAGTQQAKDFKVVVQLQDPPDSLRPGLSCTGEITTATRENVLAIPIQALTIREFPVDEAGNLVRPEKKSKSGSAARADEKALEKKEFEGVFRIEDGKAVFVPVQTGITGETLVEVLSGLEEGDTIVVGNYKTLRTLADGDPVKIEKQD